MSEQHEVVLMCEASDRDRRSTGCSRLMKSTLFFCDSRDEILDIFMDTMFTVMIFIQIQTKAFFALPSCVLKNVRR